MPYVNPYDFQQRSGITLDWSTPEATEASNAAAFRMQQAMFGNIGQGYDARDWSAIMASANPLEAAEQALVRMYSDPAYQAQNAQYLAQKGYDPAQAYITYEQMADRVGSTFEPTEEQRQAVADFNARNTIKLPTGQTVDFAHPNDGREWVLTQEGWTPATAMPPGAKVLYRSTPSGGTQNAAGQTVWNPLTLKAPATLPTFSLYKSGGLAAYARVLNGR